MEVVEAIDVLEKGITLPIRPIVPMLYYTDNLGFDYDRQHIHLTLNGHSIDYIYQYSKYTVLYFESRDRFRLRVEVHPRELLETKKDMTNSGQLCLSGMKNGGGGRYGDDFVLLPSGNYALRIGARCDNGFDQEEQIRFRIHSR